MAAKKPKNPVFVYRVKTYPHLVIRKDEWARAATSPWSPLATGAGKNRVPSICSGTWLPWWHHDALPRRNDSTVRRSRGACGPVHSTPLRRPHWSSRSRDDPLSATARFQQLQHSNEGHCFDNRVRHRWTAHVSMSSLTLYRAPIQQSFCDSVTSISTFYTNNNYYYVDEFHMTLLTLTFDTDTLNLRLCDSLGQFKRSLKTFLFGLWDHGALWH